MKNRIYVTIEFEQKIKFFKGVNMLVEDYDRIKRLSGDDVSDTDPEYQIIDSYINMDDAYGSRGEFESVIVKTKLDLTKRKS